MSAGTGSVPNFRRHAIDALEQMGISVEFSHHEGAPGQQEIDLRYADALSMADNVMTFRYVVKEVALGEGVRASFMPKPFSEYPGSAMHTHMSLFEVAGSGALQFLDTVLGNCVSRMEPGQAHYTYLFYPDGTAVDDMYLYRLERDRFMLVANAAIWSPAPLEAVAADDVRRFFEVNTVGPFVCCQHAGLIMPSSPTAARSSTSATGPPCAPIATTARTSPPKARSPRSRGCSPSSWRRACG